MSKLIIYSGRALGKSYLYHLWFREMIPTLKKGWKMGIPLENGMAIFQFKGIKKPKIIIKELER